MGLCAAEDADTSGIRPGSLSASGEALLWNENLFIPLFSIFPGNVSTNTCYQQMVQSMVGIFIITYPMFLSCAKEAEMYGLTGVITAGGARLLHAAKASVLATDSAAR